MSFLKIILGWRNWSVFTYNSFIEHIFVVLYIALSQRNDSNLFLFNIFMFYGFSVFSTSFGYLINDAADKELDARQGKSNAFEGLSRGQATLTVLFVLVIAALFALPFYSNFLFTGLWLTWIMMTSAYSVKPVRLKERGALGLFVVVLAQRVLPVLLVFMAFGYTNWLDVVVITFYIFLRGLVSDINHQLEDYHLDHQTATRTFAVTTGEKRTKALFYFVLELERFLLPVVLILMGLHLNRFGNVVWRPFWLMIIPSVALYFYSLFRLYKKDDQNPFIPGRKNVFQFLHHPFPGIILPGFLLLLLMLQNYWYGLLLLLFAWNKRILDKSTIFNSYPVMILRKWKTSWNSN